MFHAADGLYFDRLDDGSVHIRKEQTGSATAPTIFSQIIEPDLWTSIVAAVANPKNQENAHEAARKIHIQEKEGTDETKNEDDIPPEK